MRENYDEYKEIVDKHLLDYIPTVSPMSDPLYEAMQYSLNAGGKRLRPVLLLSACEFAGGDSVKALPFACAVEYIHTYSLIHDDLPAMDDDDLRRGKPTNHKVYGEGMALLAGDALLNTAFEVMQRNIFMYFDSPNELKRMINAAYVITKGAGIRGMIAGQAADIVSDDSGKSEEILEFIHTNKTGALIRASIEAGLYIAGADEQTMKDMIDFAENFGLAFQIADDILDVTGDPELMGKNIGEDEKARKLTYVSLYGLDGARDLLHEVTDRAAKAIEHYYDNAEFFTDLLIRMENRTF